MAGNTANMELNELTAVSPLDGRYRSKVKELAPYFSEFGLMRYRVMVEVEYFLSLCEMPLPGLQQFPAEAHSMMKAFYLKFSKEDAKRIKEIEAITNHDVKAVEYFIKEKFDIFGWTDYKEFIHFGLTSQDINNTAVPAAMKDAHEMLLMPALLELRDLLWKMAMEWKNIPMLARTHGQAASPTRLGKELMVFVERLDRQFSHIGALPFSGKFGGATGNFNAHAIAYPEVDWVAFANTFLHTKLGLRRQQITTQIEHYDDMAAYFDAMRRINTILLDLSRDCWMYVMMDYFKQKIKEGEVGSSAMPHKVNPIDFENAEGNLGLANALLGYLSEKLPVSRLQRDLTDSTVSRNIGVPMAHGLLSIRSIQRGLGKLLINEEKIAADLNANQAVLAEAIQTILRREKVEGAYELLKDLTRTNEGINRQTMQQFILQLQLSSEAAEALLALSPDTYTGIDLL